jgi:DNA-binding NarL/FixJ family response regulator
MPMRCLIVDDNESFLDVARTVLGRDGLDVVGGASSVAEALSEVETLRPEVVLVDIFLGDESGIELAIALAATRDNPAVILISTHAEADVSDLISRSGAAGFLPKAELDADAIRRILDGSVAG